MRVIDRPEKILEIRAGSDLFGTRTTASDTDLITIQFPPARDLLLQRVRDIDPQSTGQRGSRNKPEDEDNLVYSLAGFLRPEIILSPRGIEVLFAPESVYLSESMTWRRLVAGRRHLLTVSVTSALRYIQHQADHYGIAGSRPAAARRALVVIDKAVTASGGKALRMSEVAAELAGIPHIQFEPETQVLTVAGRRLSGANSAYQVLDLARRLSDSYDRWCRDGRRPARPDGIDWKALSHAVRVGHQTRDLILEGAVSLPLDHHMAEYIVAIKQGRVDAVKVFEEIEASLELLPTLMPHPSLRPRLDEEWIENFIISEYGAYIGRQFG